LEEALMRQVIDGPSEFKPLETPSGDVNSGVLKTCIQNKNIKRLAIKTKLFGDGVNSNQIGEVCDQNVAGFLNPGHGLISPLATSTDHRQHMSAVLELACCDFTDAAVGTRHQNS
jgi:hypothetical protein